MANDTKIMPELLSIFSAFSESSKQNKAYENKLSNSIYSKQVDTVAALNKIIDEIETEGQINSTGAYLDTVGSLTQNNAEASLGLQEAKFKLQNTAADYENYKSAIDNASNIHKRFSKTTKEDLESWDLEFVRRELLRVSSILGSAYEDPLSKKNEKKFVGRYKPGGGMTDIALIKSIQEYEKTLKTAVSGFMDNGIIDEHEAHMVLTGNLKGLDDAREYNIKTARDNIKSYIRSQNAIKSYTKSLQTTIAKNNLTGNELFGFNPISEQMLQFTYEKDTNTPMYEGLDFEDYSMHKMKDMSELTLNDVFNLWSNENAEYEIMKRNEQDTIYKWGGAAYSNVNDRVKKAASPEMEKLLGIKEKRQKTIIIKFNAEKDLIANNPKLNDSEKREALKKLQEEFGEKLQELEGIGLIKELNLPPLEYK